MGVTYTKVKVRNPLTERAESLKRLQKFYPNPRSPDAPLTEIELIQINL
jgi:hypothetical protein